MSQVLIIDDDRDFCRSLQIQLEMEGHTVETATTGDKGLSLATASSPGLILLDLKLRETDGLSVLRRLRASKVTSPVVMITGEQDMQANIEAAREGVIEYLRKPFELERILRVLEELGGAAGNDDKHHQIRLRKISENPREIVGADPAILELLKQIGLLSRSRVSVLIQGESGTGKEVVGRALHAATCAEEPFVAINCTAMVPTLLESELFGHVKGAFTGATEDKPGRLALAGSGTLFLDEIGDLPLELQPKLLRVIQEREFTPVGGVQSLPFEARIVAVTHRDLEAMMRDGGFREDLYYRLAVTRLEVPPLRERTTDIELLTLHLLWRITRQLHRQISGLSTEAMNQLKAYNWPGNVRELENVLTRAVALAKGDVLTADDLNIELARPGQAGRSAGFGELTLAEVEQRHVRAALERHDWNITHTAEALGITRPTLRKKIEDHGLSRDRTSR